MATAKKKPTRSRVKQSVSKPTTKVAKRVTAKKSKIVHNRPQAFAKQPTASVGSAKKTSSRKAKPVPQKSPSKPKPAAKPAPQLKPEVGSSSQQVRALLAAWSVTASLRLANFQSWLVTHARWVSFCGGTILVVLWTVIRHISNGINFDVVGQIGLAQQWAHGLTSGAQLGATSYLLKMPLYLLVNRISFLSPMNRLLVLALVCNIATFMLLFWLFGKILDLYRVQRRGWFYIAMLWLASIAGGVYWMDYANSRNLETVGGVALIYLALRYLRQRQWWLLPILAAAGGIIFFADSLQLYTCGLGIVLFAMVRIALRRRKADIMPTALLVASIAVGFGLGQGLSLLARHTLPVTFLVAPNAHLAPTLTNLVMTARTSLVNTLKIFDAYFLQRPLGVNSLRELLNAGSLILAGGIVCTALRRTKFRAVAGLVLCIAVINYLVYAASGQALQWATSRYLVMIPLCSILFLTLRGSEFRGKRSLQLQYAAVALIALSSIMLVGALAINLPTRHSKDAHINATVNFLEQQHYPYALSTREVGVTTTYISQGKATVLPMACLPDHRLHPTNLFYDDGGFIELYKYQHDVPILLQPDGISFGKYNCSQQDIASQFGAPKRFVATPTGGTAMIYDAASLQFPEINKLAGFHRRAPLRAVKTSVVKPVPAAPAPVAPILLGLSRLSGCQNGYLDAIVAHPDDDILFMNPSLVRMMNSKCIRTIYVTSGDDGRTSSYWQSRERGIETAYAMMLGAANSWVGDTISVNGHAMTERHLTTNPTASLIFLRLPDGNVDGSGFRRTGNVSLEKLVSNRTASLTAIDGSSSYTESSLVSTLTSIISIDVPDTIYTQVSDGQYTSGDHSDHHTVGGLALQAANLARSSATISQFVGYPSNNLASDLSDSDTTTKHDIFYGYALEDQAICGGSSSCSIGDTYVRYFSRSYTVDANQQLIPAN